MKKITILALCIAATIISICVTEKTKETESVLVEASPVNDSLVVELEQQIEDKIAKEYAAQQKTIVTVYDKQGYEHHIDVEVLASELTVDDAKAKLQSIYSGLSKSEASDVNKAYLQRVVGEGFSVKGIILSAKGNDPNYPKALLEKARAEAKNARLVPYEQIMHKKVKVLR
jgi:hypothetical protein